MFKKNTLNLYYRQKMSTGTKSVDTTDNATWQSHLFNEYDVVIGLKRIKWSRPKIPEHPSVLISKDTATNKACQANWVHYTDLPEAFMSPSEYILASNQTYKRTASWSEITNVKQNEKCTQTYADRPNPQTVPDSNKTQVSSMVPLSSHPSPSQLDLPDESNPEHSPMDSSLSFSIAENMRMERLLGSLCHININSLASSPCRQHTLSAALENIQFNSLLSQSSVAYKARLLSISSPHASAWLSVVPSPANEHQMAIKWWLGLNTSPGSPPCALCPEHPLDPLGHHAITCKRGGDAVSRHNKLRDVVLQTCHHACISAKAEAGSGLGHELRNTRPADILASNWLCGKPAAFDLTVVSPLNPTLISEAGRTAGSAAVAAELRKHSANDAKCSELGWTCIPLVAESYGAWGNEAMQAFSRLASYLATRTNSPKSKVVCSLYGRLNLTLVRANARALLLQCGCSLQEGDSSSLSLS